MTNDKHQNNYTHLARSLSINGTSDPLALTGISDELATGLAQSEHGSLIRWGLPFASDKIHLIQEQSISISLDQVKTPWLCFLHTADDEAFFDNCLDNAREHALGGNGHLKRLAATYVIQYEDGCEEPYEIRHRYQINIPNPPWGENCFDAVSEFHPTAIFHEDDITWGLKQTIHNSNYRSPSGMTRYICAWKNPHPNKTITGIRLEPGDSTVLLFGLCACNTKSTPLRWMRRQKAIIKLPEIKDIQRKEENLFGNNTGHSEIRILDKVRASLIHFDMGTLISAKPRYAYDNKHWETSTALTAGQPIDDEMIIEYVAHPEAKAWLKNGTCVDLQALCNGEIQDSIQCIQPAEQSVTIKTINKNNKLPVAVRLHIHGQADEYLAPVDRHRIPNSNWFEDYAPELCQADLHTSTYINGKTTIKLPQGPVYIEVSKGFECKPVHKTVHITPETDEIIIEIEKVLDWRSKGWVTADTHVHFLSPTTANLEGAAEGVNIVNLLASQWGELMTNAGDFDGASTFTNTEGDDQFMVRVGTENRQHVMGHISLCGYNGDIIAPMCVGGGDEAAIGDPVDILLTEWAQKCQAQDGIVVIPHSPNPRAEHAATVVSGYVDAMEIPAFNIGITAYQLIHWYRYLNCGFQIPLTGGTDKMFAGMEIGRIRAYSKINPASALDYDAWKQSMRSGNTFVTFGPLLEFSVDGHEAGSRIHMNNNGGQVQVEWRAATLKHDITSVDLIRNGEVVDSATVADNDSCGIFSAQINTSSWLCLLVHGIDHQGNPVILAHTSSVMVEVAGTAFFAAADAISILDQIEGSMAYLEHLGTQADQKRYKEMRLNLERAHKIIHDRLHKLGHDHHHAPGHHKH